MSPYRTAPTNKQSSILIKMHTSTESSLIIRTVLSFQEIAALLSIENGSILLSEAGRQFPETLTFSTKQIRVVDLLLPGGGPYQEYNMQVFVNGAPWPPAAESVTENHAHNANSPTE